MYEYLRDNLVEFADHLTTLNIPASYSKLVYDAVDAIDDMNDVIANGRWIPVSTPPKVGETVFITFIRRISGEQGVSLAHLNRNGQFVWEGTATGAGTLCTENVTHWQEYPKPAAPTGVTPREINALLYANPFGL